MRDRACAGVIFFLAATEEEDCNAATEGGDNIMVEYFTGCGIWRHADRIGCALDAGGSRRGRFSVRRCR